MRMSWAGLLLAMSAISPAGVASAQVMCPEGRTAAGDCVNPGLAQSARAAAVIFAQPKLSATAFPVLPSADRFYRYPYELVDTPQGPSPLGPFAIGKGGKVIFVP